MTAQSTHPSPETATIGQLLAAADARFARMGGYRADAWCDDDRVDLVFRDDAGVETVVASADWPEGRAAEDAAHELLAQRIGDEAEGYYFVITLR